MEDVSDYIKVFNVHTYIVSSDSNWSDHDIFKEPLKYTAAVLHWTRLSMSLVLRQTDVINLRENIYFILTRSRLGWEFSVIRFVAIFEKERRNKFAIHNGKVLSPFWKILLTTDKHKPRNIICRYTYVLCSIIYIIHSHVLLINQNSTL